jgi:hypothetical protein
MIDRAHAVHLSRLLMIKRGLLFARAERLLRELLMHHASMMLFRIA